MAITLLPETREIPELLTQISQLGLSAGLEFRLFKPEPERPADFYAEVPVSLAILGFFHDLARFFDHLSKLSRIVNVTDIKISLAKGSGGAYTLTTNCLLTTFRFLEPQEAAGKKVRTPRNHKRKRAPCRGSMLSDGHWYGCGANGVWRRRTAPTGPPGQASSGSRCADLAGAFANVR